MMQGPVLCFVFLSLGVEEQVGSAPICTHGQDGCHSLSLPELFDRVIQHSARFHGLSRDLHTEFEQYLSSSRNQIGERKCHTSSIQTPNGKDIAQSLTREELTEVILKLLAAWGDPLSNLHSIMAHQQDFNTHSGSKALEMSDMVHQLKNGVQRVAERMQLLGMISNSLNRLSSTEVLEPPSHERFSTSDHDLLYCLRRDTDKVQSYLKILKCTILPEQTC
ncbi:prolactin-like [Clupea harengus]|uniref:Prolactin-like n=1 Tax=Clupea harengus TaxID=7950 RepID=A0A6P8F2P7_CLUHA|nr:prolactin-like [Clupea harengus]